MCSPRDGEARIFLFKFPTTLFRGMREKDMKCLSQDSNPHQLSCTVTRDHLKDALPTELPRRGFCGGKNGLAYQIIPQLFFQYQVSKTFLLAAVFELVLRSVEYSRNFISDFLISFWQVSIIIKHS